MQSADFGRREYTFTVTGQLASEDSSVLRAKGQKILYEYDGLDRLVKVDYPQTKDTLYIYGTEADKATGAYNRVKSREDSSGVIEYTYGRLGEVTSETRTLYTQLFSAYYNSDWTYTTSYRSNYLGQMESMVWNLW